MTGATRSLVNFSTGNEGWVSNVFLDTPAPKNDRGAGLRTADHLPFHCGDKITTIDDPRHIGRVDAIIEGRANITWESGWKSRGVLLAKLQAAEKNE